MRRLARSTTSHTHTFRFLRPTNIHIPSNSNASQRLRWAFFGRSRSRVGEGAAVLLYPFGDNYPGHAGGAGNATLRIALHQQGINLRVLRRFAHRR